MSTVFTKQRCRQQIREGAMGAIHVPPKMWLTTLWGILVHKICAYSDHLYWYIFWICFSLANLSTIKPLINKLKPSTHVIWMLQGKEWGLVRMWITISWKSAWCLCPCLLFGFDWIKLLIRNFCPVCILYCLHHLLLLLDPVVEAKLSVNRSMITNQQIDLYNKAAIELL